MRWPLVFYDLFLYALATLLFGSATTITGYLGIYLYQILFLPVFFFCIPPLAIFFILCLIIETWVIRLLLPALKEGYHDAPNSAGFYIWLVHLSLNRLMFLHPIKNIILYSALLRYLAFRALGCKLAFDSSISGDVDLVDLSLIAIGPESVIGACTMLTGHFINKDKLHLGAIQIGHHVNIGAHCHIAPHVEIGDHSWIGTESRIAPMVSIGKNCTVEPMSVIPPGTRLEDGETFPPIHAR